MDGYEKCSLVALFIAYIVVTIYEVTECRMSQIKQILNIGNRSIH